MIPSRVTVLPLLTVLLSACAIGPNTSYVAPLRQSADAQVLADGMAEFVAMRLPKGTGPVILDPTPSDQVGNVLTTSLVVALRSRGLAVADDSQIMTAGAHHIRYLVTPLDNGDLVRVTIDANTEGSRFFVRNTAGALQSGGPFTVTQAEAMR
jgi:hypothetical protein